MKLLSNMEVNLVAGAGTFDLRFPPGGWAWTGPTPIAPLDPPFYGVDPVPYPAV